jgi:hypothetical protein
MTGDNRKVRPLRYKTAHHETGQQLASFENRRHQSNLGLSRGVNRSGRKGRAEIIRVRRRQREPASNREYSSFNPPYKAEEKNTLISK